MVLSVDQPMQFVTAAIGMPLANCVTTVHSLADVNLVSHLVTVGVTVVKDVLVTTCHLRCFNELSLSHHHLGV